MSQSSDLSQKEDGEIIETIIEYMKNNESLWNVKSPEYKTRHHLANEIGRELHLDGSAVTAKVKYLKEKYLSCKAFVNAPSGSKSLNIRVWKHYHKLRFLDDPKIAKTVLSDVSKSNYTKSAGDKKVEILHCEVFPKGSIANLNNLKALPNVFIKPSPAVEVLPAPSPTTQPAPANSPTPPLLLPSSPTPPPPEAFSVGQDVSSYTSKRGRPRKNAQKRAISTSKPPQVSHTAEDQEKGKKQRKEQEAYNFHTDILSDTLEPTQSTEAPPSQILEQRNNQPHHPASGQRRVRAGNAPPIPREHQSQEAADAIINFLNAAAQKLTSEDDSTTQYLSFLSKKFQELKITPQQFNEFYTFCSEFLIRIEEENK